MLPSKNRLSRKEINDVVSGGVRKHSHHLTFLFKKREKAKNNRYTVVVSKKVSLLANERNKIKRRIRDILRNTQVNNNSFVDGIFFTKPSCKNMSHETLKKEIEILIKK